MTDGPEFLPPEVNSSLVHGGDGPVSLEQAALAFAEAAATDTANAQTLMGIISAVRSQWDGDTAEQYAASLQPLVAWFQTLATNGAASAEQIQAAAASITQAIATAPHPVQVNTNRTTWGTLAATNFFGVNFPPMGVLDAHYLEMWFQAAFARGSSDIETEVATGSLVPFEPPPIPVNFGAMGAPVANAASMAGFIAPAGPAQAADLGVSEVSWDATLTAGAAGDGVGLSGNRPNSSWANSANKQQDNLNDATQQSGQGTTQFASQAGSMAGQAGQLPAQFAQTLTQPLQQAGQLPQQFSSILQPLMQSVSAGHGLGGLDGAAAPLMPMNFASGTGSLSAAITRPASFGGGGIGGAGGGLRLPGSSLASAEPELSAANAAKLAAGESGAASPGGTGFLGSPRPGTSGASKNPRNRYESNSLGIDTEQAS